MSWHSNSYCLVLWIFDLDFWLQVRKKAKIRKRYNQLPNLTQVTTWESDKNTRKHHIQDSEEDSPFPAGGHKAAMNKHDSMTCNKKDPQNKHRLGTVIKNILLKSLTSFMVPASSLFLKWIKTNRCLVHVKDPWLIDVLSPSKFKSRYKRG